MKMLKDEKFIINIIKFGPIIFVIIFAFFITQTFIYEKNTSFKEEVKVVEKKFLDRNKERIKNEVERIFLEIKESKAESEKLLKKMIKNRVYEAHKIATSIYLTEINDKQSKSQKHIFDVIKNALGSIIYNKGRGYFFIDSVEGISLLQPLNRDLENINKLEFTDAKGYKFVKTIVQTIKDKTERFDTYYWYKNSQENESYKKMSFYKYFEPLNVVIGTGEYIEDFENEMKDKLLNRIKKVRFDKSGYIFIFDEKGNILSHIDNKKIGLNIIKEKDVDGNFYIKDILNFAKKEQEGFISYSITSNINEVAEHRKKISYIKYYKDCNWVIGTGFYLDDFNQQIAERKLQIEDSMKESVKQIIIISLIITLVFVLLSFYVSRIITHRLIVYKKNLETKIIENIDQKETLIEAQKVAKIGSWKLDPHTNAVECSEEVFNILAIKKNNLILTSEYMRKIVLKEDLSAFDYFLKSCKIEDKQNRIIIRIYNSNNEIRWLECRGRLDKEKTVIIGTIQDITESKNLEIEKKDKEELLYQQSKLAAMGEMIGNIAHQWRQPLSIISVTATGAKLQKEMNLFDDDKFYETMDRINDSAQYLSTTIEDFRGFFDQKNKVIKEFNIASTISKTLNLISSQFTTKEIEIVHDIRDFKIKSFENELIQVLMNILNNSKDAIISSQVNEKFIFIKTYQKNQLSYIEIYDNAYGISEDIIDRIFEPYFTTKHQSQGTGVGLYMSQDIIKNSLKGKLLVENYTFIHKDIKCKGAKFTIIL